MNPVLYDCMTVLQQSLAMIERRMGPTVYAGPRGGYGGKRLLTRADAERLIALRERGGSYDPAKEGFRAAQREASAQRQAQGPPPKEQTGMFPHAPTMESQYADPWGLGGESTQAMSGLKARAGAHVRAANAVQPNPGQRIGQDPEFRAHMRKLRVVNDQARKLSGSQDAPATAGPTGMYPHAPTMECNYDESLYAGNRPEPPAGGWVHPSGRAMTNWEIDQADTGYPGPQPAHVRQQWGAGTPATDRWLREQEERRTGQGPPPRQQTGFHPHAPTMESQYAGGFVGGINPMMVGAMQGMNAHNKMIGESQRRARLEGKDVMGNSRRLDVFDHPEKGLSHSFVSPYPGEEGGLPLHIAKQELLPQQWGPDAEQQIRDHFKQHEHTEFNSMGGQPAEYMDQPQYDDDLGPGIPMDMQEAEHRRWIEQQDNEYWQHDPATLENTEWMRGFSTPDALYSQYAGQFSDKMGTPEGEAWLQNWTDQAAARSRRIPKPNMPVGTPEWMDPRTQQPKFGQPVNVFDMVDKGQYANYADEGYVPGMTFGDVLKGGNNTGSYQTFLNQMQQRGAYDQWLRSATPEQLRTADEASDVGPFPDEQYASDGGPTRQSPPRGGNGPGGFGGAGMDYADYTLGEDDYYETPPEQRARDAADWEARLNRDPKLRQWVEADRSRPSPPADLDLWGPIWGPDHPRFPGQNSRYADDPTQRRRPNQSTLFPGMGVMHTGSFQHMPAAAHVVNKPRRPGTLTDDAQKRIFDAWKPQYAAYADYTIGEDDYYDGIGPEEAAERRQQKIHADLKWRAGEGPHPDAAAEALQQRIAADLQRRQGGGYAAYGPEYHPQSIQDAMRAHGETWAAQHNWPIGPEQTEGWASNQWFNQSSASKEFPSKRGKPGYDTFATSVKRALHQLPGDDPAQRLGRYADTNNFPPSNDDVRGWNPQVEGHGWMNPVASIPGLPPPSDSDSRGGNPQMTDPFGRSHPPTMPGSQYAGPVDPNNYAYEYPDFTQQLHGPAPADMQRPGYLPTRMPTWTHSGQGSFRTGAPGAHVVGSPHATPRPEPRKPFGFYEDGTMYEIPEENLTNQERRERFQNTMGQYPNHDLPPFYRPFGGIPDYPDHGPPGAPPMRRSGEDEFRARERLHGTGYTDYTIGEEGDWDNDLVEHRHPDADRDWPEDEPQYVNDPDAMARTRAIQERGWAADEARGLSSGRPFPGMIDPFGRKFPPQMPGGYSAYAGEYPFTGRGKGGSNPPYPDVPMHGPGSWNDPTNHLLGDIGHDWRYDPDQQPLGWTNTPRADDASEVEWERSIAEGNMGGYAAYDDRDADEGREHGPRPNMRPGTKPRDNRPVRIGTRPNGSPIYEIDHPNGGRVVVTIPNDDRNDYATSIPVDPNGPTGSTPGDVLEQWNNPRWGQADPNDPNVPWMKIQPGLWGGPWRTDDTSGRGYLPQKPEGYAAYAISKEPYPETDFDPWNDANYAPGGPADPMGPPEEAGMSDADWASENEWMNTSPLPDNRRSGGDIEYDHMGAGGFPGSVPHGAGDDMIASCRYMTDMLKSVRPTIYDEADGGGDAGGFGVDSTPDRDYWRRKTPYAQPSSHMDMSPEKARKILHDGTVHGHPLTEKQRGLFGSIAGRG